MNYDMNQYYMTSSLSTHRHGKVRVGRRIYRKGRPIDPKVEGFINVIIMIKEDHQHGEFGDLGPYVLRDSKGHLMENKYQFSKFYPTLLPVKVPFSQRSRDRIVFEFEGGDCCDTPHIKAEDLSEDRSLWPKPNQTWHQWHQKGISAPDAIRYPVGHQAYRKSKALFAFPYKNNGNTDVSQPLTYVEGRKKIYVPLYVECVRDHPVFLQLKQRLQQGENLLIIEIDGPIGNDMPYYKEKYGVNSDFIVDDTIEVTVEKMRLLINDTKNRFGHGFACGMELLEITQEVLH